MDETVSRISAMKKTMRGTAGMWLNGLPGWYNNPTVDDLKRRFSDYSRELARLYPEVDYWQIVSEATGTWDNLGFLQPEEIVALTRAASDGAARGNPKAKRGVNSVLVWGEDVPANLGKNPKCIAPYAFHNMLNESKVPYEFIIIQVYFTGWDIFEVDQMLETFRKLGKPIHIESQCASRPGPMPESRQFPEGHVGQTRYEWHRPWDEGLQADWLEKMFITCLSKYYVTEWNWWDLADYEDCYYPWGGLLNKDYTPKKAYFRLRDLIKRYGRRLKGLGTEGRKPVTNP